MPVEDVEITAVEGPMRAYVTPPAGDARAAVAVVPEALGGARRLDAS
jgi:dienelactone hydrolase